GRVDVWKLSRDTERRQHRRSGRSTAFREVSPGQLGKSPCVGRFSRITRCLDLKSGEAYRQVCPSDYPSAEDADIAQLTNAGKIALRHGTSTLWQGLPVLVPVLLGGFTTNFIWCLILNVRNQSGHEYLDRGSKDLRVPLASNYIFSAVAGTIWYFQFFF